MGHENRALLAVIAAGLLCVGTQQSAAQTICRSNSLGKEICRPGAIRPMPRPALLEEGQGLELAVEDRKPEASGPVIIPSRKQTRLGTTLPDRSANPIGGPCKRDRLGNLICQ
jgi:hypothetical protein